MLLLGVFVARDHHHGWDRYGGPKVNGPTSGKPLAPPSGARASRRRPSATPAIPARWRWE